MGRSRMLVLSSLSGVLAVPHRAQYCGSKFAVQGFFNSLRMALGPKGVQITTVCPSYVQTPFHQRVLNIDGVPPARRGHFMSAEDCAKRAVRALEEGKQELVLSTGGWLAYHLRPGLPGVVDGLVMKVAARSFKED